MSPEQAVDFLASVASQASMPEQGHVNAKVAAQIIRTALETRPKDKKKEK